MAMGDCKVCGHVDDSPIHAAPDSGAEQDNVCGCGHKHIVSVGDDGADAGCERLGDGCDCWTWHE
jgi:hypothetical protein